MNLYGFLSSNVDVAGLVIEKLGLKDRVSLSAALGESGKRAFKVGIQKNLDLKVYSLATNAFVKTKKNFFEPPSTPPISNSPEMTLMRYENNNKKMVVVFHQPSLTNHEAHAAGGGIWSSRDFDTSRVVNEPFHPFKGQSLRSLLDDLYLRRNMIDCYRVYRDMLLFDWENNNVGASHSLYKIGPMCGYRDVILVSNDAFRLSMKFYDDPVVDTEENNNNSPHMFSRLYLVLKKKGGPDEDEIVFLPPLFSNRLMEITITNVAVVNKKVVVVGFARHDLLGNWKVYELDLEGYLKSYMAKKDKIVEEYRERVKLNMQTFEKALINLEDDMFRELFQPHLFINLALMTTEEENESGGGGGDELATTLIIAAALQLARVIDAGPFVDGSVRWIDYKGELGIPRCQKKNSFNRFLQFRPSYFTPYCLLLLPRCCKSKRATVVMVDTISRTVSLEIDLPRGTGHKLVI